MKVGFPARHGSTHIAGWFTSWNILQKNGWFTGTPVLGNLHMEILWDVEFDCGGYYILRDWCGYEGDPLRFFQQNMYYQKTWGYRGMIG